jgi:hypothetical protein
MLRVCFMSQPPEPFQQLSQELEKVTETLSKVSGAEERTQLLRRMRSLLEDIDRLQSTPSLARQVPQHNS